MDEDWISDLPLDRPIRISLVEDVAPDEVLRRLAGAPAEIRALTWDELTQERQAAAAAAGQEVGVAVAFAWAGHTLLLDDLEQLTGALAVVSGGTTAVCVQTDGKEADRFLLASDGAPAGDVAHGLWQPQDYLDEHDLPTQLEQRLREAMLAIGWTPDENGTTEGLEVLYHFLGGRPEADQLRGPFRAVLLARRTLTLPFADEGALVIRTDFSDDQAWDSLRAELSAAVVEYLDCDESDVEGTLVFVDDRANEGLSIERLAATTTDGCVILADADTWSEPGHPVLCVDLFDQPGRSFRALPAGVPSVVVNLNLANMDWEDFDDGDGAVFEGF